MTSQVDSLSTYTEEQFYKEFPEKIKKCVYCKKKFTTQFDAQLCSDKCFKDKSKSNAKYFKKNYTKSGRRFQP